MAANSVKQEQAAMLLSSGRSGISVAKELGLTPECISRWKISPEFLSKINEYQAERINMARESLRESTHKAAKTMDALLDSKNETIRLKTSIALLRLSNIDVPQRLFSGVGPTDVLDILDEMRKQAQMGSYVHPDKYSFVKKSPFDDEVK